jgi:rod shape-determining protein MreC
LALVVVLVVVLMKLPTGTMGKVKLAVSGLFLPLFGLSGSVHAMTAKVEGSLTPKTSLTRQIEDLRHENQQLKIQVLQDAAIWNENARLRSLVAWPGQSTWKVHLARIIARDPANWWHTAQIDLGSRDGVKPNYAVMTSDGLVGKVQSVGQTRSQIVLLGSPELRVGAVAQSNPTNGEPGVIATGTSSPQENDMVDLEYLSGTSSLRPGAIVSTSGDGGIFPANIPIGKVVDVRQRDYGMATEARVKLWANMGALQEVWVMMP